MTLPPRTLGQSGEDAAASLLQARGYRILARNFRCRWGEIDIIAEEGGYLVFVEVKTRSGRGFGAPAEAVDPKKRQRLRRVAERYLYCRGPRGRGGEPPPCRFDVVTVVAVSAVGAMGSAGAVGAAAGGALELEVIRDAFSG